MHPIHLEVLAADRHRQHVAEANQQRLISEARRATPNPARAPRATMFAALASYMRRHRRKLRVSLAADRSYVLDDQPIAGTAAPLWMWRDEAARARFVQRGRAATEREQM